MGVVVASKPLTPAPFELGGDLGIVAPFSGGPVPFRLGIVGLHDVAALNPQLMFAITGQIGVAFAGFSTSYTGSFGNVTSSSSSVALEPLVTGRLHGQPQPWLGLYAEMGFGLVPIFTSGSANVSGQITTNNSTMVTGMFRVAGGADFSVSPKLRIFVEPIVIDAYFAGSGGSGYALLAGVRYVL